MNMVRVLAYSRLCSFRVAVEWSNLALYCEVSFSNKDFATRTPCWNKRSSKKD